MEIRWHSDKKTIINPSFVGSIQTGETQAAMNWRASLSLRRAAHVWDSAYEQIEQLASEGRDLIANQAEIADIDAEGKALSVVYGIRSTGVTPRGRTEGVYYFVLCLRDERLLVFDELFNFSRRISKRRRLA